MGDSERRVGLMREGDRRYEEKEGGGGMYRGRGPGRKDRKRNGEEEWERRTGGRGYGEKR